MAQEGIKFTILAPTPVRPRPPHLRLRTRYEPADRQRVRR